MGANIIIPDIHNSSSLERKVFGPGIFDIRVIKFARGLQCMVRKKSPAEIAIIKGEPAQSKMGDKGGYLKCFLVSKFLTNYILAIFRFYSQYRLNTIIIRGTCLSAVYQCPLDLDDPLYIQYILN